MIGTGSQEDPELIRGTQPMPSSCLRVDSGKRCFSFSSSNPCEPDRKGKGVLGLLLFIEATVFISGVFGVSLDELSVLLSCPVDDSFAVKSRWGGFDSE